MDETPQILVTLSDELLKHLRKQAKEKQVPLRWLVAGLVCDSLSSELNSTRTTMTDSQGVVPSRHEPGIRRIPLPQPG